MSTSNKKPYKLGLVLSGGGAKGLAHIGVLFYLKELGIVPDAVAGTSAGSIVGSMYAYGTPLTEIQDFFIKTDLFNWKKRAFFKPHMTFKGIINPISLKDDFKTILKEDDFEACEKDLFVVATDMQNAEEKVFSKGSIVDAVLASSAYPFVFSPMEIDDIIYSDGGILNHFPLDVIRNKCEKVIGVYVSPIRTYDKNELNSVQKIALRALSLKGDKEELHKLNDCDIAIFPQDLINFNTFDTHPDKLSEIVDVGYEETAKHHNALLKLREELNKL
ncbi:hypothetical protein EI427_01750 [Flammeovirga pectinis]|uniref:PNPLA domain-containing protein n=1 Tax=Flammeovirga pectinis TaxID=2494373 RepID=A0A3Q9FMA5_9BACT|nr:patatin-like phospholipase family protein [Flammeovirga pectinis]AZQ60983.1 hypothetical protein EI427_01750 [Flammeovirga pectinis]